MGKPLVDKKFLLQKFPGKGGWTYAEIPQVKQDKHSPFGWVTVSGSIDGLPVKNFRLMPMGNGKLFFPLKASLRKILNKKEGDRVRIILYAGETEVKIPADLKSCLEDEPEVYAKFQQLSNGNQQAFINWIDAAKKAETKTKRILEAMKMISKDQPPKFS